MYTHNETNKHIYIYIQICIYYIYIYTHMYTHIHTYGRYTKLLRAARQDLTNTRQDPYTHTRTNAKIPRSHS